MFVAGQKRTPLRGPSAWSRKQRFHQRVRFSTSGTPTPHLVQLSYPELSRFGQCVAASQGPRQSVKLITREMMSPVAELDQQLANRRQSAFGYIPKWLAGLAPRKSLNFRFAKLSSIFATPRPWNRSRSDIIVRQRRSSASLSLIWFRISRRSNAVTELSAIRRQATVCQSFKSCTLRLKTSTSVMLRARFRKPVVALIPKQSLPAKIGWALLLLQILTEAGFALPSFKSF